MQIIKAKSHDGKESTYEYEDNPDLCPICHVHISPRRIDGILIASTSYGGEKLEIVFRCARQGCSRFFIAVYEKKGNSFSLQWLLPRMPKKADFGELVEQSSKSFIEIYNQAVEAEAIGLNEIAGIGFRKALEFLIKDFAISVSPDKEESIKKTAVGNVISTYVDDSRIKSTAERAVWLGNDEAHYVRKWEGKDVSDLKTLIKITANWVENFLLTEKYNSEMSMT